MEYSIPLPLLSAMDGKLKYDTSERLIFIYMITMDIFLIKKIIGVLVMPFSIVLLLLITSAFCHRRMPKLSLSSLVVAIVLLVLTSMPPISNRLMVKIEGDYPAYLVANRPVDFIVILGCGHTSDPNLPVTAQLGTCSLQRAVEAMRIYKSTSGAKIITSGYGGTDQIPNAIKVKQALVSLGVPSEDILVEPTPRDTNEEARIIAPVVRGTNVVLVTNASHMSRAMEYFNSEGITPIAAPTGYWVKGIGGHKTWQYYVPQGGVLAQTTSAWYEVLGRTVQWVKNVFK